jgi:hypothetical protein
MAEGWTPPPMLAVRACALALLAAGDELRDAAFRRAGIEIPVLQRDLHLRSELSLPKPE